MKQPMIDVKAAKKLRRRVEKLLAESPHLMAACLCGLISVGEAERALDRAKRGLHFPMGIFGDPETEMISADDPIVASSFARKERAHA